LRFQVHGTTQDVVVVVVPRRAAGAGVVAGLVVGHLVGEVVHHQREGQVIRGTPVDAGVVGDVRAPLAGLGAAGVDVVVALARIREVVRGRADAVRVQGGGPVVLRPGDRGIDAGLGVGVVVPHGVRVTQQVDGAGTRGRLQLVAHLAGVVAGEVQAAETADVQHVVRAGRHHFQLLPGDVHLRGVQRDELAVGVATDPRQDVIAAGDRRTGGAGAAVVLAAHQVVVVSRVYFVLDLPAVVVARERQLGGRRPHHAGVPHVGLDRLQVRVAGGLAEVGLVVPGAVVGVARQVAVQAAAVVVDGGVVVAAQALERIGQGRRAERGADLAAQQQAFDRAVFHADAPGRLVDRVAGDVEGVVAARGGDGQRLQQRHAQLGGHGVAAAVAGATDRGHAPDLGDQGFRIVDHARVGAVVTALVADLGHDREAGVAARQREQRGVAELDVGEVVPGARLGVDEAGEAAEVGRINAAV